jgi:integrase
MLLLAICTALRINELVNLMAEDIDEKGMFIWLRTYKGDGGLDAKDNWIKQPLVCGSFKLLTSYIQSKGVTKGKIFNFTAGSVTAAFRRILPELNIENLRWQDLRREAVSQLVELEVSKQIAKTVSRHKDDKIFDVHYSHPDMSAIHNQVPSSTSAHPKMKFIDSL